MIIAVISDGVAWGLLAIAALLLIIVFFMED